MQKHIVLENKLSELNTLAAVVETFSEQNHFEIKEQFNLNLLLDELITNVVQHGYEDEGLHHIEITLDYEEKLLKIELIDDGKAFDPTTVSRPAFVDDVEQCKVGGLGIHLVMTLVDKAEYQRTDNKNCLKLEKKLFGYD